MTPREEIAAQLLDRDEGWGHAAWARRLIIEGRDAKHDGDCTKKCHSCLRCIADVALADADQIIRAYEAARIQPFVNYVHERVGNEDPPAIGQELRANQNHEKDHK